MPDAWAFPCRIRAARSNSIGVSAIGSFSAEIRVGKGHPRQLFRGANAARLDPAKVKRIALATGTRKKT
ncbi:MAG: hypothetical protein D6691_05555 [Candidatus Hydrogenedentota bacterium]|nr:MAG: hypothetical protein D6691_05555 [Candidatus Hydrogenedentota bacterium]